MPDTPALRTIEVVDALLLVLAEIRGLRADLRRERVGDAHAALLDAIEATFGDGVFTAGGLITEARDNPHGGISLALSGLVDMNGTHSGISLGRLLARIPELVPIGDRRGVALYQLRG